MQDRDSKLKSVKTSKKISKLTNEEKKKFYDALMKEKEKLTTNMTFHKQEALSYQKSSTTEIKGISTHIADQGSDNFIHDMELSLLTEENDNLIKIDEALERLENGTYGICSDCGEQIPKKRLEAVPFAMYCVKCKEKREREGRL